jgi:hypothetical protein
MRALMIVALVMAFASVVAADHLMVRDVDHVVPAFADDDTVTVTTTDGTPAAAQMKLANVYTVVLFEDGKAPRPYATFRVTSLHGPVATGRVRFLQAAPVP